MSGIPLNNDRQGVSLQASTAFAVTPSNDDDLAQPSIGIYVGGAGNLTVDMLESGENVTFAGIPAGTFLPIMVKKVYLTGTTATLIVGLR